MQQLPEVDRRLKHLNTGYEETCLLCAVLVYGQEVMPVVLDTVLPEHFWAPENRTIYAACVDVFNAGGVPEPNSVLHHLKQHDQLDSTGGVRTIEGIISAGEGPANVERWAGLIRDKWVMRQLLSAGQGIRETVLDGVNRPVQEVLSEVQAAVFAIGHEGPRQGLVHIKPLLWDAMNVAEVKTPRLSTGFRDLDRILGGGLARGHLILVAGRPSMGKSSLGRDFARHAAVGAGKRVAFFSFEMPKPEVTANFLAAEARVNTQKLVGDLDLADDDYPRLAQAAGLLSQSAIYVDSDARTVPLMRSRLLRFKAEGGLDLAVVDYLQLMHGKGDNREQEVASVSRGLKELALELDVPVVALAQLNRALEQRGGEAGKKPTMADLRESGALENDADEIIFPYRPEYYFGPWMKVQGGKQDVRGMAEFIIGKQRNGRRGASAFARFEEEFATFSDLPEGQSAPRFEPDEEGDRPARSRSRGKTRWAGGPQLYKDDD